MQTALAEELHSIPNKVSSSSIMPSRPIPEMVEASQGKIDDLIEVKDEREEDDSGNILSSCFLLLLCCRNFKFSLSFPYQLIK